MAWHDETKHAQDAALLAGAAILRHYEKRAAIPDAPASITTEADRQAQDLILEMLSGAFPDDAFIAEENTPTLCGLQWRGDRTWIIDPIDGTRGFARKTDDFCVMIALVEDEQPVVGVVYEPVQGRMTRAVRGGGCYSWLAESEADDMPVRVSREAEWSKATLAMSRSKEGRQPSVRETTGVGRVSFGFSCGVKLAMIARGEADAYISDFHEYNDWDICAGHILVEEAGGRMTDRSGGELAYAGQSTVKPDGFIATNGLLHEAALERMPLWEP